MLEHVVTFAAGAVVALVSVLVGYCLRLHSEQGDNGDEDDPPPQPEPFNEGRFFRFDRAHLN
jgi:hypothetical protein